MADEEVVLGYRFDDWLTPAERERVRAAVADNSSGVQVTFSPDGQHMFVLFAGETGTAPDGEILGTEVDVIGPALDGVRPPDHPSSTEVGTGWRKTFDATHPAACGCKTCRR